MSFTIATWNINSVRLREPLVLKLLSEEAPDILCLQECKSPVEKIPLDGFAALGYRHIVARGQKGYNGVAIVSKLPLADAGDVDYASLGHARHVADGEDHLFPSLLILGVALDADPVPLGLDFQFDPAPVETQIVEFLLERVLVGRCLGRLRGTEGLPLAPQKAEQSHVVLHRRGDSAPAELAASCFSLHP